ncbi:MAG: amidohydrolase family protein [Acidimicrobiales bacterium]|nr:amidohydrolase family protein [Acidimicrobiales bacterium]
MTSATEPTYDLIIRNGTLIDGRRTPRYRADVGVRAGRVATIGRITDGAAEREIDATGLMVAPGVVDLHTHYDSQIYWDPWCALSSEHGVTSVVIGNCGFGFAPVEPDARERAMLTMARNEAVPIECMQEGMPWDWVTFPEFLDSLDRTPKGVNVLSYVGLNPLLVWVVGSVEEAKQRSLTTEERTEAERLLVEAMDAGACGWSAQLLREAGVQRDHDGTPMVTDLMSEDDMNFFAEALGRVGRGVIQMIGQPRLASKLAGHSGRPVIFNVLAPRTDQHGAPAEDHGELMEWLARANGEGRRVIAQALTCTQDFQFTLEDWNLFDASPLWRELTIGDVETRMQKMRDPERRAAAHEEYGSGNAPLAGGGTEALDARIGVSIDELTLAYVVEATPHLRKWEGMTAGEIATAMDVHAIDAFLDISLECDLKAGWQTDPIEVDVETMREIANCPYAVPGLSDGGAHTKFLTNGTYPTEFLSRWVRDEEIMSLEDAHWRLSAYTAQAAGLLDRGVIAEGAPADIVVYDLDELGVLPAEKVADWPGGAWRLHRGATGWRFTIVNGEITFTDGECSGATPGQLLRHGRA